MVAVNGSPIAPDGFGGAYQNTAASDRAALFSSLGAAPGFLSGGALTPVAGSLSLSLAAFRALVAERNSAGSTVQRGYHAWADAATTIVFDPPSVAARNDAVVLAVADTSAGAGAFGTDVSAAGPQVLVVNGTSGVTTPVTDAAVQAAVGAGGWMRVADVAVAPGATSFTTGDIALASASAAEGAPTVAEAKIVKTASQSVPSGGTTGTPVTYPSVVRSTRAGFAPTPTTLTIPEDGYYDIAAQFNWDASNNSGNRYLELNVDGGAVTSSTRDVYGGTERWDISRVTYSDYFTAGQVISVEAWQNSGSAVGNGAELPFSTSFLEIRQRRS